MKSVIFLTTFPVNSAFHGGQIRSRNLINAYKKAGINVITIAYYNPSHYSKGETSENDVIVDPKSRIGYENYFSDDYYSGQYSIKDNKLISKINEILRLNNIDIIHLELPWLLPLAEYIKGKNKTTKIIFGSENIENKLKKSIFNQYNLKGQDYLELLEKIKILEIKAAETCDLLICVTEKDISWFKENSKCRTRFLLVPNAVEEFDILEDTTKLKGLNEKLDSKDWCTFIASAHPPNLLGYEECVGDFISFIPPTSKLLIVGSVCDLISDYFDRSEYKNIDTGRYYFAGKVSTDLLHLYINGSKTIILPITKGEGSNLKTAEALYSRKKIVGTTLSFRGYEKYMNLPNVSIADNKKDFRNAILKSYLEPDVVLTLEQNNLINEVTWKNSTKTFINIIKEF